MQRLLRNLRDNPWVLRFCMGALRGLRALGLFRSPRFYLRVPFRGIVKVDCGQGRSFLIRSRGHEIGHGLHWGGLFTHEPASMRFWTAHASAARVVLGIGANSDVSALAAAAMDAKSGHAFEPLPRIHDTLVGNAELNPGLPIKAWPCAVGTEGGTAALLDPEGEIPTGASLLQKFAFERFSKISDAEVAVRTIDAFSQERVVAEFDLIKIDIECYEERAAGHVQDFCCHQTIRPEGRSARAGSVVAEGVEEMWPGYCRWQQIEEDAGRTSGNVLLVAEHGVSRRAA